MMGFWDRPVLINLVADLLLVFAVVGLGWAATVALQRLPVFPLREVVVGGAVEQVTRAQIEQAAQTALTGNFFTVDLDDTRALFEKLPWVRRADVRRQLARHPGTDAGGACGGGALAARRWRSTSG